MDVEGVSMPIYANRLNKYRNKRVTIDGINFQSQKEGKRYLELKQLERAGIISELKWQVKYELIPKYEINGKKIRSSCYVADFTYKINNTNEIVIEDVKPSKNYQTEVYKLKKKLFEYKYQQEIKEIY